MLNFFTRLTLLISFLSCLAGKVVANDSDMVNCNHVWKIVVLGSSSAYGYGATTYDSAWVGKFTAYIKRKNPNNEVYNLGIPGFTTYQNLCPTGFVPPANRPSPNSSFNITAALNIHPDAIIINMPTNDAANDFTVGEQQNNYERTMHLADSAHIPVWVTTTQPRNNLTVAEVNTLITMRDWTYTRFGDKAVDFWTTVANSDGSINSFYDYDYAHVNNLGHDLFYKRMIAETILDSLCARVTQTLSARAGNDVTLTLPASSVVLDGSASSSSLGGTITSYHWLKISGPVNAVITSPSSAVTTITNLTEGRYSYSLMVTDNAFNTKSDTVNIVVSSRILIDFGPDLTSSPDGAGNYWNIVTETRPGIKLSNAVTTGNAATAIGLQVINRIDGTFNVAGPGTNTGNTLGTLNDYPATVTSDFSFADPSSTNGQWKITGLQSNKQYTIKFWGTRTVSDDRIIQIKRTDQVNWQEYNAANNNIYSNGATFSFSGKTEMSFDIRVKSGSAFGYISLIDITRTTPQIAANIPPVARANDLTVSLPATSGLLDGSASSDDDGNITAFQWSQTSGSSVAQIVTPNAAITTINNLVEGIYTFQLKVTDDSSAIATHIVTVNVNSRVLFDIGPDFTAAPDAAGKYWNNVSDGLPGTKIANAITTGNTTSGINLIIVNRIDGTFNTAGPGTNTGNTIGDVGDYPASATTDFAFSHSSASNGQWKITGLQENKQYSVKFWGTRSVSDERIIRIKRFDEATGKQYDAKNNVDYNNAAVFTFTGKTEMSFDISTDSASAFGYISVVDIRITNPAVDCTPSVTITTNQSVATCSGSAITFTATIVNGGTAPQYQWIKNGSNINGATSATYTTTTLMNNDQISCSVIANTVCSPGTTAVSNIITVSTLPIVPKAGLISGPTAICPYIGTANNAVYSIAPLANATIYIWTVPVGATIVTGQGTTSITVSYNSSFGTIDTVSVTGGYCTNSSPSTLAVSKILPAIPGAISGPLDACPFIGQTTSAAYSIAVVANATSYTWTVPAGAVISSGQGTTAIQVSYSAAFTSGVIKVTANANCGSRAPRTLNISKILPAVPVAITGPASACAYIGTSTQVVYSINPAANAVSYLWTLPSNATIISGQGTTSITITFGASFVGAALKVHSVSNCASSADRSLNITTTKGATPGVVTGPASACPFIGTTTEANYTIRKVSTAGSYIWTVPAGVTIVSHPAGSGVNDTSINVLFDNTFVAGSGISVQSSGCVPSTARTLIIGRSGTPAAPAAINGVTNPCAFIGTGVSTPYKITRIAAASSYNWIIPANTSATHPNGPGLNDTIILLTYNAGFSSGTISVSAANACGTSAIRALSIQKLTPVTTPVITGPSDPCLWIGTSGATYTINKIANATSYTWTVPSVGATATHPNGAGINDTIIIVTYTPDFVNGNITARADAICGSSSTGTLGLVKKIPLTPGNITTTLISACPNRQYSYSIAAMPANAVSVTWTVPVGGTITSGQGTTSIIVSYTQAEVNTNLSVTGTNNCGNSLTSRILMIKLPSCPSLPRSSAIPVAGKYVQQILPVAATGLMVNVSPNPASSYFKITVASEDKNTAISLRIFDISSKSIEIKTGIKSGETLLLGSNYMKGIYIGELTQGDKRTIIKLIRL